MKKLQHISSLPPNQAIANPCLGGRGPSFTHSEGTPDNLWPWLVTTPWDWRAGNAAMAVGPPVNDLLLPFSSLIQIHTAHHHCNTHKHTHTNKHTHTHTHIVFLPNTVGAGNIEVKERLTSFLSAPIHFSFNDVRGCDRCKHRDEVPSDSITGCSSVLQDTE